MQLRLKVIAVLSVLLVLALTAWHWIASGQTNCTATVNGAAIALELAATESSRANGLSNRRTLPENSGMLFVFPTLRKPHIIMLTTYVPLDIVFSLNHRILAIYEAPAYSDDKPNDCFGCLGPDCNEVVEIKAGFCSKNKVKVGDTFTVEPAFRVQSPTEVFESLKAHAKKFLHRS